LTKQFLPLQNPKVHITDFTLARYPESVEFTAVFTLHFPKIRFKTLLFKLPSSCPLTFPIKIVYAFLIFVIHVKCSFHLILLDIITKNWWRVQIVKILIMSFPPLFCFFVCPRSKYLCIFVSQTPSTFRALLSTKK